jgi:phage baseplate assembly protein W
MSTLAVKLPITRNSINGFTMIGDFADLVKQNLKMLILTDRGERVMIPDFGVGIRRYLFNNFNQNIFIDIETDIRQQVGKYIPVVTIESVLFDDSDQDSNTLAIAIVYTIPAIGFKDLLEFTI